MNDPQCAVTTVYRIWDRRREQFWTSPRGKSLWNRAAFCKTAWQVATCRSWGDDPHLVIREFSLKFEREVK